MKFLRKYLPRLLLSLAIFLILLLLVEVLLRFLYLPPGTTNRYDPKLGWSHVPEARGVALVEGQRRTFRYDENGFLVTPGPLGGSGKRLLIVGDSFVAGSGIGDPADRFGAVLWARLGDEWEVVNIAQARMEHPSAGRGGGRVRSRTGAGRALLERQRRRGR